MTFRRTIQEDLPKIWAIVKESIRKSCAADYSEQQINAWVASQTNRQRWEYKIATHFFYLAIVGAKIVGFISFEAPDYLDLMYMQPSHQKKGIASKLYS